MAASPREPLSPVPLTPRTFNSMNGERGRDVLPASVLSRITCGAFGCSRRRWAHPLRSIKNRDAAVGVVAALRGADGRSWRQDTSADRHVDLALFRVRVFGRVGRNRMRADCRRRIVGRSRTRGRPGILDAELAGRRPGEVILIGGGIVPSFVCAAFARNRRGRCSVRAVNDQRICAAAAQCHLVRRTDRKTLWAFAARGGVDREHLLDMERCLFRNPQDEARAWASGGPGWGAARIIETPG